MSAWVPMNENPEHNRVEDCTVRAISTAMHKSWDDIYCWLCCYGFQGKDMPHSDAVWGRFLYDNGFRKGIVSSECPMCYTLQRFCEEHTSGDYVVVLPKHVVAALDGAYFDTWDSGDEPVNYFWERMTEHE